MSLCIHTVYIHTNTYILLLWLNPDTEFGLQKQVFEKPYPDSISCWIF